VGAKCYAPAHEQGAVSATTRSTSTTPVTAVMRGTTRDGLAGGGRGVAGPRPGWQARPAQGVRPHQARCQRQAHRYLWRHPSRIQRPAGHYTVGHAVDDWLREGLDGRAEKTVRVNRDVLQPVVRGVGQVALRDLTARHVRMVLTEIAATHSSRRSCSPTTRWGGQSGTPKPTTTFAATSPRLSARRWDSLAGRLSRSRLSRRRRC
jgi:hypothetical protein